VIELPYRGYGLAEWPTRAVVDEALADPSWHPLPFCEFTLKLHGRCNLACDYCYMYEMVDQSWRQKPNGDGPDHDRPVATRVGEHLRAHAGEGGCRGPPSGCTAGRRCWPAPTWSPTRAPLRRAAPAGTELSCGSDQRRAAGRRDGLAVLREHDIRVGVSLDGGRQAHDRHRRYANGRAATKRDARHRACAGPVRRSLRPPAVHDRRRERSRRGVRGAAQRRAGAARLRDAGRQLEHPPPGWTGDRGGTSVADWLIPIFDRWYASSPTRADQHPGCSTASWPCGCRTAGEWWVVCQRRGAVGAVPAVERSG